MGRLGGGDLEMILVWTETGHRKSTKKRVLSLRKANWVARERRLERSTGGKSWRKKKTVEEMRRYPKGTVHEATDEHVP
jgi:hypothetical protein